VQQVTAMQRSYGSVFLLFVETFLICSSYEGWKETVMKIVEYKYIPEPGAIKLHQMLVIPAMLMLVALALYFQPF